MKIKNGNSLLFIGDSITDCGRARPVGTGIGLGESYVAFVNSLLTAFYPAREITVLNTGISGNRVIDLEARWQTDVLDLAPDWLSVMIGINDVWRQFDDYLNPNQVTISIYESIYRNILEQTRRNLKGLVLMTPYYIETNLSDPMRERMDKYGKVVEKLAHEFDAIFVNVQTAFDFHLTHRPTQSLCSDRVHPNQTGHMIIAKSFLTAVGFDWNLALD
ncbi:MAG: GDSL family lipase [Chlamydiae bacterium]|nr:MAG: GDSL family lipase [Chlamydiota bacterium]